MLIAESWWMDVVCSYGSRSFVLRPVNGHGRLWEPPSRSSMFRKGYNTPANYNDMELFCGGFAHQWFLNDGKCGICGDPYEGPRENEAGGKYALGIITGHYTTGQAIDITVDVTANHLGYFEFRICPNNDPSVPATQECLDQYQLQLADGSGYRDYIDIGLGKRTRKWLLPNGVTCTQCVLQWKYHTGNSWGVDEDGYGCIGCGPQEEFYGCADIAIQSSSTNTTDTKTTSTPPKTPSPTTTKPTTLSSTTKMQPTTQSQTTTTKQSTQSPTHYPTTRSPVSTTKETSDEPLPVCVPTSAWENNPGMDAWCTINCSMGYCPETHCICF